MQSWNLFPRYHHQKQLAIFMNHTLAHNIHLVIAITVIVYSSAEIESDTFII